MGANGFMVANGGYAAPYAYTLAGKWMGDPVTVYAAWSLMRNGSTIPSVPSPGQLVNFAGSSVQAAMVGAAQDARTANRAAGDTLDQHSQQPHRATGARQ